MKIKICGMKYPENINDIAMLLPDYMGFVFYKNSPRFVGNSLLPKDIAMINKKIMKVGVFVNEAIPEILKIQKEYKLDFIQLHGNESVLLCKNLKKKGMKLIKAFHLDNGFDFKITKSYSSCCDFFIFDTKSEKFGGTGISFNWKLLEAYHNETPFFLSGGIGENNILQILKMHFLNIYGIDVNSALEDKPGLKNLKKVNGILNKIRN